MLRIIASAASPDVRAVLTMSSISRSIAETVSAKCPARRLCNGSFATSDWSA